MTTWYEKKYGSAYQPQRSWAARNKALLVSLAMSLLAIVYFAAVMALTFNYLAPRAIVLEMNRQASVVVAQVWGEDR